MDGLINIVSVEKERQWANGDTKMKIKRQLKPVSLVSDDRVARW